MNGLPPLQRWWATYVLVGSAAFVAFVAAIGATATLLTPIRHILLVLLFAIVVSFVLAPLVSLVERVVQRRAPAVLVTFIVALAVVVGGFAVLATPVVRESRALAERIPSYVTTLQSDEALIVAGIEIPGELRQRVGTAIAERGGQFAERAAEIALRVVTAVIDILLVLVVSIYLLASARRVRLGLLTLLPTRHRVRAKHAEDQAIRVFGGYVRGQLLLGLIIGTASTAAYVALGLPYAVFLGVLAGVLELVPILGPIVAGAVAALVALVQPDPFPLVIWVIIAATAIQQLENQVLVPRISGTAVGIHPVAALLAVLIGVEIAGIIGALFAVPATGLAWALGKNWLRSWRRREDAAAQ